MDSSKGENPGLLLRWKEGEPQAFEALMPLVYPHLREVAAAYVRRERNPGVMQATGWSTSFSCGCCTRIARR